MGTHGWKASIFRYLLHSLVLFNNLCVLGMNSGEIMVAIVEGQRPEIPTNWPSMYSQLIQSCWKPRREQRPTFKRIMKHIKRMLGGPTLDESRILPVLNTQTTTTMATTTTTTSSSHPTYSSEFFSSEGI